MSSKKDKIANKKFINIVGAREHNLKNIDVNIPKDSITAVSYTHLTLPTILLV